METNVIGIVRAFFVATVNRENTKKKLFKNVSVFL